MANRVIAIAIINLIQHPVDVARLQIRGLKPRNTDAQ